MAFCFCGTCEKVLFRLNKYDVMKKIIWKGLNKLGFGAVVQLKLKSLLLEDGWLKSFHTKQSVDAKGEPLPWCTYAFIKFLEPRLKSTMRVFEYGCGNSTLWYAKRVASVAAVEHDKAWYEHLQTKVGGSVTLYHEQLEGEGAYSKKATTTDDNYHIIVVDGRERNNCVKNAMRALTEDGVIVFDNSQIESYQSSLQLLTTNGFRRIDFIGLTPIVAHENTTTIFYKDGNCLGI